MTEITPKELKDRIDKGEDVFVLDVREEWEYEESNIGMKLFPLGEIPIRLDELEPRREQEIIVHCKTGKRGNQARKFLISRGFTNVRNLEGGIEAYLSLNQEPKAGE